MHFELTEDTKKLLSLSVHNGLKAEAMLAGCYALILGLLFYSFGNFGFLNIFGLRREMQIALSLPIFIYSLAFPRRLLNALTEPVVIFVALLFLSELALRQNLIIAEDRFLSILVVGLLFSISTRHSDIALRTIITLAAIFSIMAIVQAVFIWYRPDLVPALNAGYSSMTQAAKLEVHHPIGYLGFGLPIVFSGHDFARFESFAAEPSVVVYSFFVPGILALSYKGPMRLIGMPILFFSIVLSQSGTIWLSILFAIAAYPLFYLAKHRTPLLAILPFLIAIGFFVFIMNFDIPKLIDYTENLINPIAKEFTSLSKYRSAMARFASWNESLTLAKDYYIGTPFNMSSTTGLLLYSYLSAGIAGLLALSIVLYKVFKLAVHSFRMSSGIARLAPLLVYGTLVQVMIFSDYGWTGVSGFIMLSLVILRLRIISSNQPSSTKSSVLLHKKSIAD